MSAPGRKLRALLTRQSKGKLKRLAKLRRPDRAKSVDSVATTLPPDQNKSALTLSLPTKCITDAVSSQDQSPEKGEQAKLGVRGTLCGVRIRKNLKVNQEVGTTSYK